MLPHSALPLFTPVGQETGAPVLILYWLTELPSRPPATVLISVFSLLRCTFIYVCACRSFCSWFWGRVLRRSGWSKTLNVNKADFRFIEICLPLQAYATAPSPAVYCTVCEQYPWKPEKGTSSPGTGVARICELPIRLGTEPGSSVRAVSALNHWAIRPVSSES